MNSANTATVEAPGPGREVLRGPGPLESTSTQRHSLGFYTAVCCTARFTAAPSRVESASSSLPASNLLYTALHEVVVRHPPLAVSIEDESTTSARYVRLSSIDLERMVNVQPVPAGPDEATRHRMLNDIIQTRLSSRFSDLRVLPPWRIVVFLPEVGSDPLRDEEFDVALFIHHAIADGVSAVIFMQTLLTALNAASTRRLEEYPGTMVSPSKAPFLPPLEELHPLPVSYFTLLRAIWHMWFPPSRVGLWTGKPVSRPSTVVQSRVAVRVLSAEATKSLLAACHAHKTTLTPLLEALLARAFFASLPTDGSADILKCTCPINLRPFLPPEFKATMGVFVSADEHVFRREDTDIWKEAKRAGSELARVLDGMKRGKHSGVGILRYIRDMRAYFEGLVDKPRDCSFEISNTGAVDGSSGVGPWRMSRLLFAQSASVIGAAVKCSVSSVRGGPMTLSASWVEGVVEETVVDATLKKLVALVNDYDVCSGKL